MKRLLCVLMVLGISGAAMAQGVSLGIKAGANFSNTNFSGSGLTLTPDGLTSFHGGLYLKASINDKIAIQPEFLYSMQGFSITSGGTTLKDTYTYLQIPVLFKYNVVPAFNFHFGPQYAILMKAEETLGSTTTDIKDQLKSGDFGIVFGLGFDLPVGFNGGVRYVLGTTNIDNTGSNSGATAKNTVIQLYIGMKLFGN